MRSKILIGHVNHRRFSPVKHSLSYKMFMLGIDLDELDTLKKRIWGFGDKWWHWARFRRNDYCGRGNLKQALFDKLFELTGEKLSGRTVAVIHLRYLGLYFSPVNFYYIYDEENEWRYVIAEVSNTPWNERHYYAIPVEKGQRKVTWHHKKAFHVSPFNPIDQTYDWVLKPLDDKLFIHLSCSRERKEFDALLSMKAFDFSSRRLLIQLLKTPIMTVKVVTSIYWQAAKLWFKGAPFYSHPKYSDTPVQEKEPSQGVGK